MLRYRMRRIIKLLESNSFDSVRDQILLPENEKALKALIDLGCVKPTYAWGHELIYLDLLDHSAVYALNRQEVWLNRIFGFIAGALTTVAGNLLVHAISELLSR